LPFQQTAAWLTFCSGQEGSSSIFDKVRLHGPQLLIAEIYHDAEASRKQSRVTGIARKDGWEKGRLSSYRNKTSWAARRKSVSREANQYRMGILLKDWLPVASSSQTIWAVDLSD